MARHPYYAYARGIYDQMVAEVKYKTEDFNVIGTYVERRDGYPKASGQAKYASDFQIPGMLYGKLLKCPYAHARIKSLDTSKAEALPGVKAVLTYEDEDVFSPFPRAVKDMIATGCPFLPQEANWQGETIGAAVCAETEEICDEALKLLDVEWEELPFVLNAEDAGPENIWMENTYDRGLMLSDDPYQEDESYDVEQGFLDSDVIIETQIKWHRITMNGSEPDSSTALWEGDKLTLWVHNQHADSMPGEFNNYTGLPLSLLNVVMLYQGGMFGQGECYNSETVRLDTAAALLARKTGKPVHMQMSRKDYMHGADTDMVCDFKIGAKEDGTILAVKADYLWGGGAPGGYGMLWGLTDLGTSWVKMDLKCAVHSEHTTMFTNTLPEWWWRSEQNLCAECLQVVIDRTAEALSMDPAEVMLKNARVPEPSLKEAISKAKEEMDWDAKWHKPGERTLPNGKLHGLGFYFGHEWGNYTDAHISLALRVNPDGTVTLIAVKDNMGLSEQTTYAMIVAEEMGMRIEDVNFPLTDTDCGYALQGSGGAAALHPNSWISAKLAIQAKAALLEKAAPVLGVTPEELDIKDSIIFEKANPENAVPVKGLFARGHGATTSLNLDTSIHGMAWSEENVMRIFSPMHTYQAHFIEVEVDPETGGLDITKVVNVNDVGKAVRPETVEGQQYGGTYMGIGRAIMEDTEIYDPMTGVLLNSNLLNCQVPINLDCGPIKTVIQEGVAHGDGAYGTTGIGEDCTDCMTPATIAAVYNAVGKWVNPPVTPDRILKALGKA